MDYGKRFLDPDAAFVCVESKRWKDIKGQGMSYLGPAGNRESYRGAVDPKQKNIRFAADARVLETKRDSVSAPFGGCDLV